MKLSLCAILLAGGLLATAAPATFDDEHGERRSERAYENGKHKGHTWNAQEDRAYRQYLKERNRNYRPWNQTSRAEQEEYWRWRDSHSSDYRDRVDNRAYRNDRDRDDQNRNRDRDDQNRNRDRDDR